MKQILFLKMKDLKKKMNVIKACIVKIIIITLLSADGKCKTPDQDH